MKTLQNILIIFICTTIWSCNNSSSNKTDSIQDTNIAIDTSIISNKTDNSTAFTNDYEEDVNTITNLKFNEFSISINRLIIYDEDKIIDQIQIDTVEIYAELGETIEGQLVDILTDQLTDLTVEQRYETSVTIMNEGPHCDLTDWKHYYSDWKLLKKNENGQFVCESYEESDWEKFPLIEIEELKEAVRNHCSDYWYYLVKNIKSPTEYPSGVLISRYFLRVTGKRKDNGQPISKLIIIETPMGC